MEELTRRGFLTGVAKAAAGTGLIIAATDKQIEAFTGLGSQVSVLAPEHRSWIASGHQVYGRLHVGQQLYDEKGKIVAVVQ